MSLYRRVSIRIWGDERFMALSRPKPNAQTLFFYLLTGPHTGPIPGLFMAGEAQLAEALSWPPLALRARLLELSTGGLVIFDAASRMMYLPNSLKHNAPNNPNMVVSWRAAFADLPDCELVRTAFQDFKRFLEPFDKPFRKPFDQPLHQPLNRSGNRLANGLPNSSGSGSGSGREQQSSTEKIGDVDAPNGAGAESPPVTITPEEAKGLPKIAQARGITLAQCRSELVTAKLREREGRA
jgi:hypothetical protein